MTSPIKNLKFADNQCGICLNHYGSEDEAKEIKDAEKTNLKCGHVFHESCFKYLSSCPLCLKPREARVYDPKEIKQLVAEYIDKIAGNDLKGEVKRKFIEQACINLMKFQQTPKDPFDHFDPIGTMKQLNSLIKLCRMIDKSKTPNQKLSFEEGAPERELVNEVIVKIVEFFQVLDDAVNDGTRHNSAKELAFLVNEPDYATLLNSIFSNLIASRLGRLRDILGIPDLTAIGEPDTKIVKVITKDEQLLTMLFKQRKEQYKLRFENFMSTQGLVKKIIHFCQIEYLQKKPSTLPTTSPVYQKCKKISDIYKGIRNIIFLGMWPKTPAEFLQI